MKIFLLFDRHSERAKKTAAEIQTHIEKGGFEAVCIGDTPQIQALNDARNLTEARFLLFIADSTSDFSNTEITSKWRFFSNEIRWKRKTSGDIILIASDSCDLTRIPFSLRDSCLLKQNEVTQLNKLLNSFSDGNAYKEYCYDTRIRKGTLKVEMPTDSLNRRPASQEQQQTLVQTMKAAVQAKQQDQPTAADSQIKSDNGCKKDHVFERREFKRNAFSGKTEITQVESEHKHEENKPALPKPTSSAAQKNTTTAKNNTASTQKPTDTSRQGATNQPQRNTTPSNRQPRPNSESPKAPDRNQATDRTQVPNRTQNSNQTNRPAPTSNPQQRPTPSPTNRPNVNNTPQNKPVRPFSSDNNNDDYDPFAPPEKKPANAGAVFGCLFAGVIGFIFFIMFIIMLSES